MWVRVARFEGGTAAGLEAEMASTQEHLSKGPPAGLEAVKRVVEGINRDEGTGISMVFCDTEEELRQVGEVLNNMSPSSDAAGRRVSAGMYEVMNDEQVG
jgi:hypothetical protein